MRDVKYRKYITTLFSVFMLLLAVSVASAETEEKVFEAGVPFPGWSDEWSWNVSIDGNEVTAKPWGGVYIRFVGGDYIDAKAIDFLTVHLNSDEEVLVSLVCDCGNQPVYATKGNVRLSVDELLGGSVTKVHGVMIQSTFNEHSYVLNRISLTLNRSQNQPTPTNTPQPLPTATNTPLPTSTSFPTATNTPLPTATATSTSFPTATSTPIVIEETAMPQPPTSTPVATRETVTPQPTNQPTVTQQPTQTPTAIYETVTPQPTNQPTVTPQPTDLPTVTPRPTNQPTATQQPPTQTPTVEPPARCLGRVQEAEDGEAIGLMQVINDSRASGGKVIESASGRSDASMSLNHRIDFCVRIATTGNYEIVGRVLATGNQSNSLFVTIDGAPAAGMVWHMEKSSSYADVILSAGGSPEGGNPPLSIYLAQGDHTISFYHREKEVRLDKFEVVPVEDRPTPTPQPTETPSLTLTPDRPNGTSLADFVEYPINYSNVGITGGIPNYPNTIRVSGFTEKAIEDAISQAKPFTKILLPAGTYNVGTIDIRKSNIVLMGEANGCGRAVIRFSNDTGINVGSGGSIGSSVNLAASASLNSKRITVSRGKGSGFSIGDYVFISQNDDSSLFRADLSRATNPEDWVKGNATQMNKIVGRDGDTLILEGGLNLNYKTSLGAKVAKVHNMVSGVGVENLTLERTQDKYATGESGNILFKFVANSWVRGIHSKNSIRAHIYMTRSYKNEVRGNYLDRSFDNGGGGHGYGARLQNGTTDTLVENNIAKLLRHSYIAQIGANGNVFAYNYSADPYGESHGEIYTDLSAHGGFAHSNLFEGNQAQMAKIDNNHASSSMNIFFRNRLEQDLNSYTYKSELTSKGATTPHIWIHENQYFNSFLANEISFPGANQATQTVGFPNGNKRENFTVCKYINSSDGERGCGRTRDTTVNHGTYDYLLKQTTWDSSISKKAFPNSAYLSSKPPFWGNRAWPMFGPDMLGLSESQKVIPAKARYTARNYCYLGS